MHGKGDLIQSHGGYRKLRSFQTAQQVYDATVVFCKRFVDPRSRTRDQMVQAARSGVQNIAEGSMASATSKKTELKLTGVARASLEELLLDYEDFLRQRGLRIWDKNSPEALAVGQVRPVRRFRQVRRVRPLRHLDGPARNRRQHAYLSDQPGQLSSGPPAPNFGAAVPFRRRIHRTALPPKNLSQGVVMVAFTGPRGRRHRFATLLSQPF